MIVPTELTKAHNSRPQSNHSNKSNLNSHKSKSSFNPFEPSGEMDRAREAERKKNRELTKENALL